MSYGRVRYALTESAISRNEKATSTTATATAIHTNRGTDARNSTMTFGGSLTPARWSPRAV